MAVTRWSYGSGCACGWRWQSRKGGGGLVGGGGNVLDSGGVVLQVER